MAGFLLGVSHMAADILPFKSRFDIDCEAAISDELFGPSRDGGKASIQNRRKGLGLRPQAMPGDNYAVDNSSTVDLRNVLDPPK